MTWCKKAARRPPDLGVFYPNAKDSWMVRCFFLNSSLFFKNIFWRSDIQLDYDCKIFGGWSRILRHSEMLVKADVWLRMMQPLAINRVTVSFLGRHLHPERFDQGWFSGWLARISWEQTIWQTAAPSPAGDCRVLMMISRILWWTLERFRLWWQSMHQKGNGNTTFVIQWNGIFTDMITSPSIWFLSISWMIKPVKATVTLGFQICLTWFWASNHWR